MLTKHPLKIKTFADHAQHNVWLNCEGSWDLDKPSIIIIFEKAKLRLFLEIK
jgi:hypothetical protein